VIGVVLSATEAIRQLTGCWSRRPRICRTSARSRPRWSTSGMPCHAATEGVVLLPVRWETHAMPETGVRPQDAINRQLVADCDGLAGKIREIAARIRLLPASLW